jgi:hypothetical protein
MDDRLRRWPRTRRCAGHARRRDKRACAQLPLIVVIGDEQPDGRGRLRVAIAGIAEIQARVAPLIPVYRAVAQSPAGAGFRRSEELRREGMAELAAALAAKTSLQTAMTLPRASDLLFVLTGPEVYRSFVQDAGWSHDQWIEPRHHERLPTGHRQQRDHQHRPRAAITHDLCHRRAPGDEVEEARSGRPGFASRPDATPLAGDKRAWRGSRPGPGFLV